MFQILNQSLWLIATIMIFLCGIYFSFRLKFIHLNFKQMFRAITQKSHDKEGISSFQALSMSLARKNWCWFSFRYCSCRLFRRSWYAFLDLGYFYFLCYQYICRNRSCLLFSRKRKRQSLPRWSFLLYCRRSWKKEVSLLLCFCSINFLYRWFFKPASQYR